MGLTYYTICYHVDGADAQGAYHYLEATLWEYHLLLQRTLKRNSIREEETL